MSEAKELPLLRRILAVLVGGFCGTVTRYLLSLFLQAQFGKGWPYDILIINLTGALLLSFLTTLADAALLLGPTRRLFLNVGFLGAYTTFSSLALGVVQLSLQGLWSPALLYLILSLLGGIVAVLLGSWLAELLIRRVRPERFRKVSQPAVYPDKQGEHIDIQDDLFSH